MLYLECEGRPVRVILTHRKLQRLKELQQKLKEIETRKNEKVSFEIDGKECSIRVYKNFIDIGCYTYSGWDTLIPDLNIKSVDDIPDVYFSNLFLYYLKTEAPWKTEKRITFSKIVRRQDKPYLVYKLLEKREND